MTLLNRQTRLICLAVATTFLFSTCISRPLPAAQNTAVYVTASLLDKNNLFIEDLRQDEIRVSENGQIRELEFMAKDELPTVYGLVFEEALLWAAEEDGTPRGAAQPGSTPVSPKNAAYELIDKYVRRQAVWVASYTRELQIAGNADSDGTRAKELVQQLRGSKGDDSFLYAPLFSAVQKMNARHEKRRVLILFLDSLDANTASKVKPLKNLLAASNVELFVVSFASKMGNDRRKIPWSLNASSLRDLAHSTSGEAFFTSDYGEHLDDLTRRLLNQVRTLYTFGFEASSTAESPGQLHIQCLRAGAKVRTHAVVPVLPGER